MFSTQRVTAWMRFFDKHVNSKTSSKLLNNTRMDWETNVRKRAVQTMPRLTCWFHASLITKLRSKSKRLILSPNSNNSKRNWGIRFIVTHTSLKLWMMLAYMKSLRMSKRVTIEETLNSRLNSTNSTLNIGAFLIVWFRGILCQHVLALIPILRLHPFLRHIYSHVGGRTLNASIHSWSVTSRN